MPNAEMFGDGLRRSSFLLHLDQHDPEARPGELVETTVPSRALHRDARVTLYLPARYRRTAVYPLLVVHDGGDYLQYAAAKTVLDNLITRPAWAGSSPAS